jgi:hypothetical protein
MAKLSGQVAADFARDVVNEMANDKLMKKYSISSLHSLGLLKAQVRKVYNEQNNPQKKTQLTINKTDFLQDLRGGLDNSQLIEKYRLKKERYLQQLFRKLIDRGDLDISEIADRLSVTQSQVREAFKEAEDAIRELD